MILRDKIIETITEETPDNQGGFISKDISVRTLDCKASFNTRPEVMTAYGQNGEQVLYIVTREPLLKEAFYLYCDKKYSLRLATKNKRLFFSTLIEIK